MTTEHQAPEPAALAATFGTPLYVYDLDRVRDAAADLLATLPEPATLLYSVKANPNPEVVRELLAQGCWAEISSSGELAVALEAGCLPAECFYTGPGKTWDEIADAICAGVQLFSLESLVDLRRVAAVARSFATEVRGVMRVNGTAANGGVGLRMTGEASQFGTDADVLRDRSAELWGTEVAGVRLVGFHFYPLTNAVDEDVLGTEILASITLAAKLGADLGLPVDVLDLGGGFASPFAAPGTRPRYPNVRRRVEAALDDEFPAWRSGRPRVLFESGRHLVGDSGTLLTSVSDVKVSRGTRFAVLDTGINHLGGLSGIGRLLPLSAVPILVPIDGAPARDEDLEEDALPVRLVGPLCTPADTLGRATSEFPALDPGQLLAIPNVGAYGATASLVGFLSRPGVAEVVVRDGAVTSATRLVLSREALREVAGTPSDRPAERGAQRGPDGAQIVDPRAAEDGGPAHRSTDGPWDENFVPVLLSVLQRLDDEPTLAPETSLRGAGLDSLAMVDLLVRLEDAYGVRIPDEALGRDAFATAGALWSVLDQARRVS